MKLLILGVRRGYVCYRSVFGSVSFLECRLLGFGKLLFVYFGAFSLVIVIVYFYKLDFSVFKMGFFYCEEGVFLNYIKIFVEVINWFGNGFLIGGLGRDV